MNQLLQDRKLVLVLDLDNTLLHTKSIEEREFQTKSRDPTFINLIDPLKSIYEIKLFRGGFHTKLRPFLFEFLKKVFDERKFEIYFYTAGTKDYGMLIIDIFKMEITRLFGKEYAKQISEELSHRKLISRCDKERFANKNSSNEIDIDSMQQQLYQQIENQQMGQGGDATLNMKHFIKSLSSLAGGDESIFIIIDDRSDVWTEEVKDQNGNKLRRVSDNLILIPEYFYWETSQNRLKSYHKIIQQSGVKYDFDLSLVYHYKLLTKIHNKFYEEVDSLGYSSVKPIIRDLRTNIFQKNEVAIFDILFMNDKQNIVKKSEIDRSYEGMLSQRFGLGYQESIDQDCTKHYIFLVDDYISNPVKMKKVSQARALDFEGIKTSVASIYWLYLSCHFYNELPLEAFNGLKESKYPEEQRINELLSKCLEIEETGLYESYKERFNMLEERKKHREYVKKQNEEHKLQQENGKTQNDHQQEQEEDNLDTTQDNQTIETQRQQLKRSHETADDDNKVVNEDQDQIESDSKRQRVD
eukprot:403368592